MREADSSAVPQNYHCSRDLQDNNSQGADRQRWSWIAEVGRRGRADNWFSYDFFIELEPEAGYERVSLEWRNSSSLFGFDRNAINVHSHPQTQVFRTHCATPFSTGTL